MDYCDRCSHADPCCETVPRNHQYRYSQSYNFKASIFVRQLHPGRVSVPHGCYSKRYKPSRTRFTENKDHGPSVCDGICRPVGSLCTVDRPSSFCRESKREVSKPREAHSKQTRRSQNGKLQRNVLNRDCSNGNLLQHGSLGSSKNQFHSHSRRFSGNVRRKKSGSRFNSGYDEYPGYWASLDAEITSDCMHPRDGFLVSPEPHHRRRRPNRTGSRFSSGYDEYPRYWASLDKEATSNGQFQTNNPTDLKNNYKPPRKSRRRKAQVLARRSITTTSSASEPESPTAFTEPVYHITWDGDTSKECEHFEQICPVCENDLSHKSPGDYSYFKDYSNYEDDMEPPKLPEVAVLPCGHAFHSECLMQLTEEEQSREPPCFFCISCLIY